MVGCKERFTPDPYVLRVNIHRRKKVGAYLSLSPFVTSVIQDENDGLISLGHWP